MSYIYRGGKPKKKQRQKYMKSIIKIVLDDIFKIILFFILILYKTFTDRAPFSLLQNNSILVPEAERMGGF